MKKEKNTQILFYVLIFIAIISIILLRPINDLDELWNYNFARNIGRGLIPYKDFNMIITPLLSIICGVVLKLTCDQLIVMRILAAILCSAIIFTIYNLLLLLKIKKEVGIIFSFFIGCLFIDCFCIDYNFATLLIVLIIIFREIKLYKKDNIFIKAILKEEILLGILAGLCITLKQTTGLLICIALLGNKLLFVKEKEEFKIFFKSFIYRLSGVMLPILLILLYLIYNNAFFDFISYTIKGIAGFSNYISYNSLIKLDLVGVLAILVPITFIYTWYKTIIKEKEKKEYILLVYGLAIFIVTFPISNKIHFLIGATPTIVLILYNVYRTSYKLLNRFSEFKKIIISMSYLISSFIILFTVYYSSNNLIKYIKSKNEFSILNRYSYVIISKNLENQIKKVDEYILKSKDEVKILDATAVIYMIPIDRYNKDYDLLLKGNLGWNGEERIIEQINVSNNMTYLVLNKKYSKNWQTPLKIIEYIENNKEKEGQIEIFDIYK